MKVRPVVDRLDEVKRRVNDELMKIEARRVELKNFLGTLVYISSGGGETVPEPSSNGTRVLSAKARRAISRAQRLRWKKQKQAQRRQLSPSAKSARVKALAVNHSQPAWTPKQDAIIISALRRSGGPVDGPEFSRSLEKKLKRTHTAIWQHVKRMSERENPAVKVVNKDGRGMFEAVS